MKKFKKIMRILQVAFLMITMVTVSAQTPIQSPLTYESLLPAFNRLTPEAASLGKYGSYELNEYNGTPDQRDTMYMDNYVISFFHPGDYSTKTFNYEEGYFYDLFVHEDKVLISFHYGSMNYDEPDDTSTLISDFQIKGVLRDRKWKYVENGVCYYKRVISASSYHINISYERVVYDKVEKYNKMFDNICIAENDYIGNYIFSNGKPDRLLFNGGYCSFTNENLNNFDIKKSQITQLLTLLLSYRPLMVKHIVLSMVLWEKPWKIKRKNGDYQKVLVIT